MVKNANETVVKLKAEKIQAERLPVGLMIAQLVEHCTGIADVMGSKPVQV